MKTSYSTKRSPTFRPPAGVDNAYVLFNTAPSTTHRIDVEFDRREGLGFALQMLAHSLRHRRWSFFVTHKETE